MAATTSASDAAFEGLQNDVLRNAAHVVLRLRAHELRRLAKAQQKQQQRESSSGATASDLNSSGGDASPAAADAAPAAAEVAAAPVVAADAAADASPAAEHTSEDGSAASPSAGGAQAKPKVARFLEYLVEMDERQQLSFSEGEKQLTFDDAVAALLERCDSDEEKALVEKAVSMVEDSITDVGQLLHTMANFYFKLRLAQAATEGAAEVKGRTCSDLAASCKELVGNNVLRAACDQALNFHQKSSNGWNGFPLEHWFGKTVSCDDESAVAGQLLPALLPLVMPKHKVHLPKVGVEEEELDEQALADRELAASMMSLKVSERDLTQAAHVASADAAAEQKEKASRLPTIDHSLHNVEALGPTSSRAELMAELGLTTTQELANLVLIQVLALARELMYEVKEGPPRLTNPMSLPENLVRLKRINRLRNKVENLLKPRQGNRGRGTNNRRPATVSVRGAAAPVGGAGRGAAPPAAAPQQTYQTQQWVRGKGILPPTRGTAPSTRGAASNRKNKPKGKGQADEDGFFG